MIYSIAVIGSGMAGLAAAYRARYAGHHVTVFEACNGHGMDAHALTAEGGLVDVPLRVMSPDAWPSLLQRAGIPDLEPPLFEPDPDTVLARVHKALTQWHRQPVRKVFFSGSWAYHGVPLLESAVRSADAVMEALNESSPGASCSHSI